MGQTMMELKEIEKQFGKKDAAVKALRGVNLCITEGEYIAVMGKSGSGKSTLLNVMGGNLPYDSGTYYYKGGLLDFHNRKRITEFRRREIGFIVQYFALVDDLNVFQNVSLPLKYLGISRREQTERVQKVLEELGIADKRYSYPNELSGGQQQRVAIARALIKKPQLILADEPTGALDEENSKKVQDILQGINEKGTTVIVVTHDESVADRCKRVVYLRDGVVVRDELR